MARAINDPGYVPLASSHRAQSRRRRDLVAIFLDALGGRAVVSELQLVQVRKAAELTTAAEVVRSPPAKGPPTQDVLEASSSCGFEIQSDHRHLPAMSEAFDPGDFSFVVKMRGAPAKPWVWEIHRAGKSGPVERSPVCYASMAEAAREGKKSPGTPPHAAA